MAVFEKKCLFAAALVVTTGCGPNGSSGGGASYGAGDMLLFGVVVGATFLGPMIAEESASPVRSERAVRTTRMFGGRGQFDPASFSSYGVVAFPTDVNRRNVERYGAFCEAFVDGLDPIDRDSPPPSKQAITVWPVVNTVTDNIYEDEIRETCSRAMQDYDIVEARQVINLAIERGRQLEGRKGPFLIATYPGAGIRDLDYDGPFLTFDLSDYNDPDDIERAIRVWSTKLLSDPLSWMAIEEQGRTKSGMWNLYDTLGESADGYLQLSN